MEKFKPGMTVICIDSKGIPKPFALKEGEKYVIREIGSRTGGLRLEGITLFSDLTGYEKCYDRKRFKTVKQ